MILFAPEPKPEGRLTEIHRDTLTLHKGFPQIERRLTASSFVGSLKNLQAPLILSRFKEGFPAEDEVLRRRRGRRPLGRYYGGGGRRGIRKGRGGCLLGISRRDPRQSGACRRRFLRKSRKLLFGRLQRNIPLTQKLLRLIEILACGGTNPAHPEIRIL